jgi:hypothetical protein
MVQAYLEEQIIEVKLIYSHDLSRCGFWFNPYIKSKQYSQFENALSEYILRLEKCVEVHG